MAMGGALLPFRARHAHRNISFPVDDTEVAGIGHKFDLQSRLQSHQGRQRGDQNMIHHERCGGDAHLADGHSVSTGHTVLDGIDLEFDALSSSDNDLPAVGRSQPARVALEKAHSKLGLDAIEAPRYRGFVDAQLPRCASNLASARQPENVAKVIPV